MYDTYMKELLGYDKITYMDIETEVRMYKMLIDESFNGDMALLHVKDRERLRNIIYSHNILNIHYAVDSHNKIFYESFYKAYNDIAKNNGLDGYFETNSDDYNKYIGNIYHKYKNNNAYENVCELCFDRKDISNGRYSSYNIILTLNESNRHIFIKFEDNAVRDDVIKISKKVIQDSIDRLIIEKYNIKKGE